MPKLTLLESGPGTGKTSACLELFRVEALRSPSGINGRSFFVLPNREHVARIQSLLLKKDMPGLFNARVVTFQELEDYFLEPLMSQCPSQMTRQRFVREILLTHKQSFGYIGDVCDLPGFQTILTDTIREFKQARFSPERLTRAMRWVGPNEALRHKCDDLLTVLREYDERLLVSGMREREDLLEEALNRSDIPAADLVIFDGFYHFTEAQKILIQVAAKRAEHVVVTLMHPNHRENREDLFYYTGRTADFLKSRGFERYAQNIQSNHRVQSDELKHLEANLFSARPALFSGNNRTVSVLRGETMMDEIRRIASEIRRIHYETEWHFSDMVVILRSMDGYEQWIRHVFEEYEIPVQVHERKKLAESGSGLFMHHLLSLYENGWERNHLFYLLKSGYFPEAPDSKSMLRYERFAYSKAITAGRENWLAIAGESADISKALHWLVYWHEKIQSAKSPLEKRLLFEKLIDTLILSEEPSELREDRESVKCIKSLFRMLLSEREGAVVDFRPLLHGIEAALFSVKPAGKNRVQVYDVVMAIPKEYRVVFAAGMVDGIFPRKTEEDAVLKDDERVLLNGNLPGLEIRRYRQYGERFFFYAAVTRARNRLYLSYPEKDSGGKPYLPSSFLQSAQDCFADSLEIPGTSDWISARQTERDIANYLSGAAAASSGALGPNPRAESLMSRWRSEKRFMEILNTRSLNSGVSLQDAEVLAELSSKKPKYSASRIETYLTCPYQYFSKYVLKVKPAFENRTSMEMGTVLHAVFERFFKSYNLDAGALNWDDEKVILTRLNALLQEEFEKSELVDKPLYRQKALMLSFRQALVLFAKRERELSHERKTTPRYFELEFGSVLGGGSAPYPYLKMGDGKVHLEGKIDRVDIRDGYALVVDYKLSRKSLKKKIEKGLEVQLPIYLLAVKRLLGLTPIGAELRFLTDEKKSLEGVYAPEAQECLALSDKKTISQEQFEQLLADTEKRVLTAADGIHSGNIAIRSKTCQYCPYDSLCRFEKWKLIYENASEEVHESS